MTSSNSNINANSAQALNNKELFATFSPSFINKSKMLRELTYRQLIIVAYVAALAGREGKRKIPMPPRYGLMKLLTRSGCNVSDFNVDDYDNLALFIFEDAPAHGIWDVLETKSGNVRLRFKRKYWEQNFRDFDEIDVDPWVKCDIELMLRLNTKTEIMMALLIESWVNKPGKDRTWSLQNLADLLGLTDGNRSRLRSKIERTFKEVKRELKLDGRGLDIEFENIRHSVYVHTNVHVRHLEKDKRGKVQTRRKKYSDAMRQFEREQNADKRDEQRMEQRAIKNKIQGIINDHRSKRDGMTILARRWPTLVEPGSKESSMLMGMLRPDERHEIQRMWAKNGNRRRVAT